MRNAQVSLSLVRTNTITNDDFPSSDATVSSVCSPTTDTDGATEHVAAPVSNHDVDDENRIELGRTRRLQSLVVPGGHPRLAGTTCEAVRCCRGRACVAPRPRSLSGGAALTRSGHSVSVNGLRYVLNGSHPSLPTTSDIVHARMASWDHPTLLQGWVPRAPLTVLRGAYRQSPPASACAVQRRNWLKPGLGEHHQYSLATYYAGRRSARPSTARVSVRAPGVKSAPKGYLFRG